MTLDLDKPLRPIKPFRNTWLRKWDWDPVELREATRAGRVERIGKAKYEIYVRIGEKGRNIVVVDYEDEIFVIARAEGR